MRPRSWLQMTAQSIAMRGSVHTKSLLPRSCLTDSFEFPDNTGWPNYCFPVSERACSVITSYPAFEPSTTERDPEDLARERLRGQVPSVALPQLQWRKRQLPRARSSRHESAPQGVPFQLGC